MSALLRLVHDADRDWPPLRRRRLAREVRTALDCVGAVWEADGIQAATACLNDHVTRIGRRYPADWRDIAEQEGVL